MKRWLLLLLTVWFTTGLTMPIEFEPGFLRKRIDARKTERIQRPAPKAGILAADDQFSLTPQRRAFLDTIAYAEGTFGSPNGGYNTQYGGGQFEGTEKPRDKVKIGKTASSAAGRYQFLNTTWDEVQKKYGLPDFSPASQDRGALARLKSRGALKHVDEGNFQAAINKSNREWASFPGAPYGQPTKEMDDLESFYQKRLQGYTQTANAR